MSGESAMGAGETSSAVGTFERARPRLLGLAYRMLGVMADAEDIVQEAWLRWQGADPAGVERPDAWLTTVTTRLALDRLRSAQRRREQYVGPWLPEPILVGPGPEDAADLSDSLTLGFLVLLDRLQPVERAAFLLADVFRVPYAEVASSLGKSEAACRQVVSRARKRLSGAPVRRPTGAERRVLDELVSAILRGDADAAVARLAPDVVLVADGGAERKAARRPIVGAEKVVRLLMALSRQVTGTVEVEPVPLNGEPGLLLTIDGKVDLAVGASLAGDRVSTIWLVRNPDKLHRLREPSLLE
jgi:RNA polymerase sigma-70 factor (ECF subfamily)